MLNDAHGKAERMVELAHPLGIALGQVVVDGDEVRAFSFERIQVDGRVATRVLPSPVFISAMRPLCRIMPPINCTSKCRMFKLRRDISRQTAKASGRMSSSVSPASRRFLNSWVLSARA